MLAKEKRVAEFDKIFKASQIKNSNLCSNFVEKIKDRYDFGDAFFISPSTEELEHSILSVAGDESRVARCTEIQYINFYRSRGIQVRDALYVFFGGSSVEVRKISNCAKRPLVNNLPSMPV